MQESPEFAGRPCLEDEGVPWNKHACVRAELGGGRVLGLGGAAVRQRAAGHGAGGRQCHNVRCGTVVRVGRGARLALELVWIIVGPGRARVDGVPRLRVRIRAHEAAQVPPMQKSPMQREPQFVLHLLLGADEMQVNVSAGPRPRSGRWWLTSLAMAPDGLFVGLRCAHNRLGRE